MTTGLASACAVVLALVFGVAAVAKGIRPGPTAAAFRDLGVPAPAALAVAVPAAEAVVALALIVRPDVGAALALVALAIFTGVVVRALAVGSKAGCGCFGTTRPEPVSPADVVRNGFLAAFAAVATGTAHLVAPSVGAVLITCGAVGLAAAVHAATRRRTALPR